MQIVAELQSDPRVDLYHEGSRVKALLRPLPKNASSSLQIHECSTNDQELDHHRPKLTGRHARLSSQTDTTLDLQYRIYFSSHPHQRHLQSPHHTASCMLHPQQHAESLDLDDNFNESQSALSDTSVDKTYSFHHKQLVPVLL